MVVLLLAFLPNKRRIVPEDSISQQCTIALINNLFLLHGVQLLVMNELCLGPFTHFYFYLICVGQLAGHFKNKVTESTPTLILHPSPFLQVLPSLAAINTHKQQHTITVLASISTHKQQQTITALASINTHKQQHTITVLTSISTHKQQQTITALASINTHTSNNIPLQY